MVPKCQKEASLPAVAYVDVIVCVDEKSTAGYESVGVTIEIGLRVDTIYVLEVLISNATTPVTERRKHPDPRAQPSPAVRGAAAGYRNLT